MGYKINKQNPKNWEVGDTFAIKIVSDNKEYDGRYFIINKIDHENFSKEWKYPVFRAKITKDCILPETKEEIEKLEYIKTGFFHYADRFCLRFNGIETYDMAVKRHETIEYYPDEYDYLYIYHLTMFVNYRNYKNLIYLGNYSLSLPKDETYIEGQFVRTLSCLYENVVNELLNCIKKINLKASPIYNEDREEIRNRAMKNVKMHEELLEEVYEKFRK